MMATNRAFVVYERCLDVLFHCISCNLCHKPTQNIAKFVDSDSLFVKLYCSSGHQLLHWSSCSSEGIQIQQSAIDSARVQELSSLKGNETIASKGESLGGLSCDDERYTTNSDEPKEDIGSQDASYGQILVKIEKEEEFQTSFSQADREDPGSIPQETLSHTAQNIHSDDPDATSSDTYQIKALHEEVDTIDSKNHVVECEPAPELSTPAEDNGDQQTFTFQERTKTANSCVFCCKLFSSASDLESHERTHTGERRYECRYCSKKFIRWSHVKSHEFTHTGFQAFPCCFCGRTFPLLAQCRAHERTHVIEPQAADTSIILSSSDSDVFAEAYGREGTEKENLENAPYAGSTEPNQTQTLDEEANMIDSSQNHEGHETLVSDSNGPIEGEDDQEPIAFTERIRTATTCRFCCKLFPSPSDLESHERTHTGERPYECRFCSKGFIHWSHVKSHELTHTGFRSFACCFCGKRFPLSTQCRAHERTHTTKSQLDDSSSDAITREQTEMQCMDNETDSDSERLRNSKLTSPETQPVQTNPEVTSNLKANCKDVSFVPTVIQPNILCCQFCGKQLSSMECRKLHERIHTGEKPFKCSYCSKMFADKSVCKIHERIHTGDRPYTCRFCGRKFSQSSHCRGHERTHTGEMPYKCQYCGQSFRYKTSQINHEKLHVSGFLPSCRVCKRIFRSAIDCRSHEYKHHSLLISKENTASIPSGPLDPRTREDSSISDEVDESQEAELAMERKELLDGSQAISDTVVKKECVTELSDDLKKTDAVIMTKEVDDSYSGDLVSSNITPLPSENCQCSPSETCGSEKCRNKTMDPKPPVEPNDNGALCSQNVGKTTHTTVISSDCPSKDLGIVSIPQDRNQKKPNLLWQCKYCPKQLQNAPLLKKHELMHRTSKAFRCQHCPKLFTQLHNCKMHESTHMRVPATPWSCTYCGRRFVDKSSYLKHEYQHMVKPFKCSYCTKSYSSHSKLLAHERIHSGTSSHACQFCGKRFPDYSHCISHERTHTGEKPFKCPQCEKRFTTRSCMNKHVGTHTVGTPFKCSFCEKSFKTRTAVRKHELNHTKSANFQCCYCHKAFKLKQSLQAHERCHTGERPFPCRHCDKRFSGITARRAHERIHTGELPYKCEYCNRLFRHSNSLTRHIRNHTGEKPYECSHCGKMFKDLKQKKVHERTHTGERPFVCSFCDKSFTDSSTMVKHERIHTGERPYKCTHCDETFAYSTTRKKHEQTHHS